MERVDADLIPFAKNNTSGYRFAFGTDTATDDINANYNDNIKKGWGTTPNEFPEVEDFNAMAYTSSYLTAYLYQMGISEWNNKQKYKKYSRVIGSDGKIYKAKGGTDLSPNVNNNPTTDTTNWEDVLGNFVTLTGNQTIAGIKTFSSSIVGNITGNAATATWAAAFTTAVGSAPSYACRAWVNFNGTGTVAIRASGNVSSITDNGIGNYTVNFTTAMPDANYSAVAAAGAVLGNHPWVEVLSYTTSSVKVYVTRNISSIDGPDIPEISCCIFR